jgi:hypothetical protein
VFDLLLLAEVNAVIGELSAALLVHAGGVFTSLDRALGRIAARSLEEELQAVAAAKAANWSGVSCHVLDAGWLDWAAQPPSC